MKVRRSDQVVILSGNDRGKTGKILKIFPSKGRVIVSGVHIMKRHTKPNQNQPQGGIVEKEASIDISNVMLICPKCGEPTRIAAKFLDNRKKVRTCKICSEVME